MRPGLLALTGRIGHAEAHTHACHQLLIVASGHVVVEDDHHDRYPVQGVAFIPAGFRHRVIASPDASGLAAWFDADSPIGLAAATRWHGAGDLGCARTWTTAVAGLPRLTDATPHRPARPQHPVLARAIHHATTTPSGPPDLETLAAAVSMSPSRLGHLFAERLGLSYPIWRRWIMLQRAIDAVRAGANLTAAAHTTGFADSAHLTRTTKAMFGITPTQALTASGWRP
ncbi:AraC family transcriptional regulator [Stackebrandtia nassauensis]|nr:AraC family transcriptional regulator [Stackebrandtia nassauensis]